ncbi:response regulator transcription factor [Cytophagales bacterium LB-30]|uniref:Response regulator transcription factor n=1 Tax=Shiella aurantiaca TaxID=3058365 RepID=A0ABT8F2B4_9BACT|nr:response regulator transcription factor [Shiella aurantiaca]MDN4164513.1 response regulator transcription factor [Shiella aurantiaca]
MSKILLVEDDPNLGQILQEYLHLKGYETMLKRDGEAGWEAYRNEPFQLCILDVMMPKKDGFTLAKEIRAIDTRIPILFLTAKSMKEDTLEGFKIGADDYLTKPFSMEELLLRIKAILKRTQGISAAIKEKTYTLGRLTFDTERKQLQTPTQLYKLTSKESELLELFCLHLNQVVNRNYALQKIWGDDSYFNARSMDVYISKLRKMLREEETIQIMTQHGQGFKLVKLD